MKILVTGGARSGKTGHALQLAEALAADRVYVATAEALDEEMRDRIRRHQDERDPSWVTVEAPLDPATALSAPGRVVLLDCLTLWVNNLMCAELSDAEVRARFGDLVEALLAAPNPVVLITNEVGMGIVPMNAMARRFRDLQGWMNQDVARVCDAAWLMASGLPLQLK